MPLVEQITKHKVRAVKTAVLYLVFFTVGLSVAIPGPTLLDLQLLTNSTLSQITYILSSRSAGYAIGSIVGGILIDFVDQQLVLIFSLLITCVSLSAVPWISSLWGIIITFGINGIFSGAIDSVSNIWILHIWGKESPPFMQALHFAFGLGAFLAPLLAQPFLVPIQTDPIPRMKQPSHKFSVWNKRQHHFIARNVYSVSSGQTYTSNDLLIKYPYTAAAMFGGLVLILFVTIYCFHKENKPHPTKIVERPPDEIDKKSSKTKSNLLIIFMVLFTAIFLHIYSGLEMAFGTLLTTFTVKENLHLDKSTGSYISSLFWGTFTFFRCVTVFLVDIMGCEKMLIFDLVLIMVSNLILVSFASRYAAGLWIGVAVMGLGASSVLPTIFGYLEQTFSLSSRMASVILGAACFGEFVMPFIAGSFIDDYPETFIIVSVFCGTSCCIIFAVIQTLVRKYKRMMTALPLMNTIKDAYYTESKLKY